MKFILKIVFASLFFFSPLFAQTTTFLSLKTTIKKLPFGLEEYVPANRPKIALALSGGGVRGLSQIGVLKALKESDIPIDIIVGTSMGSVVGGFYSAGYTIEQMDSIAVNTDWAGLLASDRETNRRELFVDQKITEDKAVFSLRLNGLKPILPTSINNGQKISNFLNLLTLQAPIHVNKSFNELKYKFRAVCTDLISGEPVILSEGSLSRALRASSSVSFFLAPVEIDSLILVDGGLVANIPVSIAENLGADYSIAVNTTSPLHSKKDLNLPWIVADQVVSIPMKLLNEKQLIDANCVIKPDLRDKSSADFTGIDSLISAGYNSALPCMKKIKHQIDSLLQLKIDGKEFYLKNVMITGNEPGYERPYLNKYIIKDSVSSKEILLDIYSLLNSGDFKNLGAEVTQNEKFSTVIFKGEKNTLVKHVEVYGVTLINNNQVESEFSGLIGTPYNAQKVFNSLIGVIDLYRDQGYSLAEIDRISFDEKSGQLKVYLNEGIITSFRIEGDKYTTRTVITREFPLRAGEYFKYDRVKQGLINLRSTNLFDDIFLRVIKSGDGNTVILQVKEKASSLLRVGFYADNENKLQLSFDIRDDNLFGSGTELGLLLSGGTRTRSYILEHKSNRVFNTYLTYNLNAFYKFNDVFTYSKNVNADNDEISRSVSGEYRQIFYGTSLSIGTQVEKFGNLIFKGKYEFDRVKNKQGDQVNPYKTKIVSLKVSTTIDTQDKYPYPLHGVFFNGYYEVAQKIMGGQIGFTNLGFDYKSHFTFNGVSTVSPGVKMGFADKTLPLSQQYSFGGQDNFFGLRENEFRGRQIFISDLEYRYKLPIKIFFDTYFKFRYDLGWVWDEQERIRFKDLRHGIGSTLSFDTPVGPANFSVGRSFLFVQSGSGSSIKWGDVMFYFSIGYYY